MAETYKILLKHRQGELIYSLEYPLIVGNKNAYACWLEASSIREWIDDGEIKNITLTYVNTKSNKTSYSTYETVVVDGITYYKFGIPPKDEVFPDVLDTAGKLQMSLLVEMSDGRVYSTLALSYPPDIYPSSASAGVQVSLQTNSDLAQILQSLRGGEEGKVLICGSKDYYFNWGDTPFAKEAAKLETKRAISLTGAVAGSTAANAGFDGNEDCSINVTSIDFSKADVKGTLPWSVVSPEGMSTLYLGGTVGVENIITVTQTALDEMADDIKPLLEAGTTNKISFTNFATLPAKKLNQIYLLCATNGSYGSNLQFKSGDWLLCENQSWTKIESKTTLATVRGANEETAQTKADVVLGPKEIGAASADTSVYDESFGYPALCANKLTKKQTINGLEFNGENSVTSYCYCTTQGAVSKKEVNITNFKLVNGAMICIVFKENNTAEKVTLQINQQADIKPICINGEQIGTANMGASILKANYAYLLIFDETIDSWIMCSGVASSPTQLTGKRSTVVLKRGETKVEVPQIHKDAQKSDWATSIFVYLDGELVNFENQYTLEGSYIKFKIGSADYDRTVEFVIFYSEKIDLTQWNINGDGGLGLKDNTEDFPVNKAKTAQKWTGAANIFLAQGEGRKNLQLTDSDGIYGPGNIVLPQPAEIRLPKVIGNLEGNVKGNIIGDVTGNVFGNADTVTKLKNNITIGSAPFNGEKSISLTAMGAISNIQTVTIASNEWVSNKVDKTISGLKTTDNVIVYAASNDSTNLNNQTEWSLFKVQCIQQAAGKLTFQYTPNGSLAPTKPLIAQVVILPGKTE